MPKDIKTGDLANLIREVGKKARDEKEYALSNQEEVSGPAHARVYDVLSFIEAPWGLNMHLFPAQRFIVKLYYNLPLDNTRRDIVIHDMFKTRLIGKFTEVEYLKYLYNEGRCNLSEQDHMRRQLVLSIGRRAGKTTLSAIFASYEMYRLLSLGNPQAYYGLPAGNRIQIIAVATAKDQAGILFNDVTSHVAKCDYFKPYIVNNTQSVVRFRTPYDIQKYGPTVRHADGGQFQSFNGKASLQLTFKAAVSTGLRGAGNIVIILDEMAHFQDQGKSSAKDIYDSITPSASSFSPKDPKNPSEPIGPVESRIICISSPLNKAGKFYELYNFAMSRGEGSEDIIAIQAPTWEINPTVEPNFLRNKYFEDPRVFVTEFGAQFSDRVRGWVEREQDLIACIDTDRRPKNFGPPRYPHQLGLDVGLVGDGTTVAITHIEEDRIVLDYHEAWYAGVDWRESNPHLDSPIMDYAKLLSTESRLDFERIADWIHALSKRFYITNGLFDSWNGIPLEQLFIKRGMNQFKSEFFTRELRSRMFQAVKLLIFDKKVVLYDWPPPVEGSSAKKRSPLIEEILALQAEQISHNQILVKAPEIAGAHDDMSDALVRAVWLPLERMQNTKIAHPPGGGFTRTAPVSTTHYQRARMRSHGVFTERMAPRGLRNPLLRGR